MRAATAPHPRDVYAEAEQRLGRKLYAGERRIDIAQLDRDLKAGKEELRQAVEKEKRRAILAYFRYRKRVRLNVTPRMRQVLMDLFATGQRHARKQVAHATSRSLAGRRPPPKIVAKLAALLHQLEPKVAEAATAAGAEVDIGTAAWLTMVREVSRLPGALDVASRIVNEATYAGMGDVYSENAGLFERWIYSAVMDDNTCDVCEELDGDVFDSWDAIQDVLPDGGPNPDCYGEGRCRCMAVPE